MEVTQFTKPLSKRQVKLVLFIHDYIQEHNYPPSQKEMWEAMGIKSINVQVKAAINKGWLAREEGTTQRNIYVTSEGKKRIDTLRIQSNEAV